MRCGYVQAVRCFSALTITFVVLSSCRSASPPPTASPTGLLDATTVALAPTDAITETLATAPAAPTVQPTPDLAATVIAGLPPAAVEPVPEGEELVQVLPLHGSSGRSLWAVASLGRATANFQHFVAVYTGTPTGWQELARVPLSNPTILRQASVVQESLTAEQLWIGVRGDSGLVGPCCYDLLRFDGTTLHHELSVAERNIQEVSTRVGADKAPELVVTIQPWGGAVASPGSPITRVFYWNGQQMVPR